MSASTNVTIWCDGNPRTHDGRCHQSDTAPGSWTIKDLRAQLTSRGWRCGVLTSRDEHARMPTNVRPHHEPNRPGFASVAAYAPPRDDQARAVGIDATHRPLH